MKSLLLFWVEEAHPPPTAPKKVNFSREKKRSDEKKQSKNTQTFSDPLKQQEN